MTERGEIEVKGKGKMYTYFLIRNRTATENEIMGNPIKESDSDHGSVQSFHESRIKMIQSSCQQGRVGITENQFFPQSFNSS